MFMLGCTASQHALITKNTQIMQKKTYSRPVMEPRDLVAVPRRVSRPIFASLGLEGFRPHLGLEGYRSRDFEYCKEWYSKISTIQ